jgi:EAL domain-containing protein (putative c-di-GMP-specific phosphodiesterase class I)
LTSNKGEASSNLIGLLSEIIVALRLVVLTAANEEIFTELERLSCDAVQGAYISSPPSAEEFSRWFQDSPWRLKQGG